MRRKQGTVEVRWGRSKVVDHPRRVVTILKFTNCTTNVEEEDKGVDLGQGQARRGRTKIREEGPELSQGKVLGYSEAHIQK